MQAAVDVGTVDKYANYVNSNWYFGSTKFDEQNFKQTEIIQI